MSALGAMGRPIQNSSTQTAIYERMHVSVHCPRCILYAALGRQGCLHVCYLYGSLCCTITQPLHFGSCHITLLGQLYATADHVQLDGVNYRVSVLNVDHAISPI